MASTAAKSSPTESKVDLRYLGPSDVLNDRATGTEFEAKGDSKRVAESVAARLEGIPGEEFERVRTRVRK